nr:hypothetical protein [Tanacetum cinerariifolium]
MCSITEEIEEVWFTVYEENGIFQDFLNTFESSNDNTNVVNAPQEPFVFNQDPGENSSQSPPHIDHHCCYGCGNSLDSIFCHQCTCESCGNGAHYGYNFPPKVLIISNPELCHNQNVDEFPKLCHVFNPPPQPPTDSYEFCQNDAHYSHDCPPQVSFIYNLKPCYNQDFNFPKNFKFSNNNILIVPVVGARMRPFNVLLLAWDRVSKIKDAFGNKQYKPEDIQELIQKLFNDVQNIHEELAEYINTPSWNCPAFYNYNNDDDKDYTIAITPVLSTEDPVDSLIMEDEHLDTISATGSDEVIKSSVEDLVSIPSESEGILDNMCDMPFHDNSSPIDISKEQFEDLFDSSDDFTSIDDDSFSIDDIDYVEASPPHSELVNLEEIEALNANPTPSSDFMLKSPSLFPNSFLEETDTSDNPLPESEIFCFDIEEKNNDSTTIHADISLLDLECFYFKSEPDPRV